MKRNRFLAVALSLMLLFGGFAGVSPCKAAAASQPPVWEDRQEYLLDSETTHTYRITVPEEGRYELVIEYRAENGRRITPQAGMVLTTPSGQTEERTVDLPRLWVFAEGAVVDGRFTQDGQRNELAPSYQEVQEWQERSISLSSGDQAVPAGQYQLDITMKREAVTIRSLELRPLSSVPSYAEYIEANNASGAVDTSGQAVRQEAELIAEKSHLEITVNYDRTSPAISPNDPTRIRYNLLGGSQFGAEGQWVSWTVDIPSSGYYELDFVYRQNLSNGLSVRRRLYIDGAVPFEECQEVLFPYTDAVKAQTVADQNGQPYRFYLTEGTHTIRMEAVLTGLQDTLAQLDAVVAELNLLYSRIMVLVGENPDSFRDYNLEDNIEGLTETLEDCANRLDALETALDAEGSSKATLADAARTLRSMMEKPRNIPGRMDQFRTQINALADLSASIRSQPLELDYFVFRSPETAATESKASFWDVLSYRLTGFLGSFFEDYNAVGGGESDEEPISVWVSANDLTIFGFAVGRDQAQIVNLLATDSFVAQTGIPVRVSLIDPTTLIPAIVSGKGPDVVLFVQKETLSGLYYRNALVDLTQMPDFENIKQRFNPSSFISLSVGDKVFALPEVQSYNMMFYRTDIFEANGLQPPDTWSDFYTVLNRLHKKSMQVGVPVLPQTYEMLLLQNGGTLYNKDISKTNMTSTASVTAFSSWTELYTKYGLPVAYDALNRFRGGQMPLLLAPGYFYGQLSVGAPEIAGQWAMLPLPATETAEGKNRQQASSISGAAVLADSDKQEAAFRFVDWWTSDDIQERFAFENESRIGISGRYFPANKAAFESLPWTVEESDALREQWLQVSDNPQSPATYYVTRNLNNAFRRAVYDLENPRDVIYRYGQMVDSELTRKREELGIE